MAGPSKVPLSFRVTRLISLLVGILETEERSRMYAHEQDQDQRDQGFTLIESLVTIVVAGILAAVAIVGIGGVIGTAKGATCKATMDSSRAALLAYYAKATPNAYPPTFGAVIAENDLALEGGVQNPGAGVTLTDSASAPTWTLTLTPATGALVATGADSAHCA
jgi:prepilin-type N-terminal cleavage/methylation domain-containing protein